MFNIDAILFIKDFQDNMVFWNLKHKKYLTVYYKKKKKTEGSKMFFSFSIHGALEAFFTVQKRLSAA